MADGDLRALLEAIAFGTGEGIRPGDRLKAAELLQQLPEGTACPSCAAREQELGQLGRDVDVLGQPLRTRTDPQVEAAVQARLRQVLADVGAGGGAPYPDAEAAIAARVEARARQVLADMAAGAQAPYPEVEAAIVARAHSLARTWQAADDNTASAEGEAGPVQERPASGDERPQGALRAAPPRKELPAAIPDPYSPDDLAAAGLEPEGELAWPDDEPRPLADLFLRRRRPSGGRP